MAEVKVPCEVYSRVVGYIRPVQDWNVAKQQEFEDRVMFNNINELMDIDLEGAIGRVEELAIEALYTDGGHHKQWYLEQILLTIGVDLGQVDTEWEKGIAP